MNAALSHHIFGSREPLVVLPDGVDFGDLEFCRSGDDLTLSDVHRYSIIVRGFFVVAEPPALKSRAGEIVPGSLARILVNLSDRAVSVLLSHKDEFPAAG